MFVQSTWIPDFCTLLDVEGARARQGGKAADIEDLTLPGGTYFVHY